MQRAHACIAAMLTQLQLLVVGFGAGTLFMLLLCPLFLCACCACQEPAEQPPLVRRYVD